jgi:hypothetical protein
VAQGPPELQGLKEGRLIGDRAGDLLKPIAGGGGAGELTLEVSDRALEGRQTLFKDRFV